MLKEFSIFDNNAFFVQYCSASSNKYNYYCWPKQEKHHKDIQTLSSNHFIV